MTAPSSTPRPERAGTRGRTWEAELRTVEVIVEDDDGESPFGWRELPPPNRATRRALARRRRQS